MKPTTPARNKLDAFATRSSRGRHSQLENEPTAIQVQPSAMIYNQVRKQLWRSLSYVCGVCFFLMFLSKRNSNRDRDALVALERKHSE